MGIVSELVDFYKNNKKDDKIYTIQKLSTFYLSEEYFEDEIKRIMKDEPEIDEDNYDDEYNEIYSEVMGDGEYHESAPIDEESTFYELYEYNDIDELNSNVGPNSTPSSNSILEIEKRREGVYHGTDFDPWNTRRWEVTVKLMDVFLNENCKFDV